VVSRGLEEKGKTTEKGEGGKGKGGKNEVVSELANSAKSAEFGVQESGQGFETGGQR